MDAAKPENRKPKKQRQVNLYACQESLDLIKGFARVTRRSLSGAVEYLATTHPEMQEHKQRAAA